MKKPSTLRKSSGLVLMLLLSLAWFSPTQTALRTMPDTLALTQGQMQSVRLGCMTLRGDAVSVTATEDETLAQVTGQSCGTSEMWLSILGIPLKKVQVEDSPEKRLIPGGQALGVAMRTEGVLIVGVGEAAQGVSPARDAGLQAGDVIMTVGGEAVTTAESLTSLLSKSGGKPVPIAYQRDGEPRTCLLTPHKDEATGAVRLGACGSFAADSLVFRNPDGSHALELFNPFEKAFTVSVTLDAENYCFQLEPRSVNSILIQ